ncbi:ABC transporter [Paenarthrobacter nicotinovorans]|nr:ABC transporter [Paenarthrobacter nicotinovorans]
MSLTTAAPQLHAEALTIGYEQRVISENLNVRIPEGKFTVIVGPNACGKSTLLRALARLIKPRSGQVLLDGKSVTSLPRKGTGAPARVAPPVLHRPRRHHGR